MRGPRFFCPLAAVRNSHVGLAAERMRQRRWIGALAVISLLVTAVLVVAHPVVDQDRCARGSVRTGSNGANTESRDRCWTVAAVFVYFDRLSAAPRHLQGRSTSCSPVCDLGRHGGSFPREV